MPTKELSRATGRRKEAVARVRLIPGEGNFVINGSRTLPDYFPNLAVRRVILEPFEILELTKNYDVLATIEGGGTAGQAGALRHGIARALVALDPELGPPSRRPAF